MKKVLIKRMPLTGRIDTYRPHSIVEVDDNEARLLVDSGYAEYVGVASVEQAVSTPAIQRNVAPPVYKEEIKKDDENDIIHLNNESKSSKKDKKFKRMSE